MKEVGIFDTNLWPWDRKLMGSRRFELLRISLINWCKRKNATRKNKDKKLLKQKYVHAVNGNDSILSYDRRCTIAGSPIQKSTCTLAFCSIQMTDIVRNTFVSTVRICSALCRRFTVCVWADYEMRFPMGMEMQCKSYGNGTRIKIE